MEKVKIAVLVSGGGTNLQALINAAAGLAKESLAAAGKRAGQTFGLGLLPSVLMRSF